eukprot:7379123-Prymnesium_polylepis.1
MHLAHPRPLDRHLDPHLRLRCGGPARLLPNLDLLEVTQCHLGRSHRDHAWVQLAVELPEEGREDHGEQAPVEVLLAHADLDLRLLQAGDHTLEVRRGWVALGRLRVAEEALLQARGRGRCCGVGHIYFELPRVDRVAACDWSLLVYFAKSH